MEDLSSYRYYTAFLCTRADNRQCISHQCNHNLNCSNNALNKLFHNYIHNDQTGSLRINLTKQLLNTYSLSDWYKCKTKRKHLLCKSFCDYLHTLLAQRVSVSRFTSSFTVASLSVKKRVIQTVTDTVVNTVVTIGTILTYYIETNYVFLKNIVHVPM